MADFYHEVMTLLQEMALPVKIWSTPVEIPAPIPFEDTVLTAAGVRVHPCLAEAVEALFEAAHADGIDLGAWGWRSRLPSAHCSRSFPP